MHNFTYYRTPQEAVGLLDTRWGGVELLAGGTDLLALQGIHCPARQSGQLGGIADFGGIKIEPEQVVIGPGAKLAAIAEHPNWKRFPALTTAAAMSAPADSQHGNAGRQSLPAEPVLVFPRRTHTLRSRRGQCFASKGKTLSRGFHSRTQVCHRASFNTRSWADCSGAIATVLGPNGQRTIASKVLQCSYFSDRARASGAQ